MGLPLPTTLLGNSGALSNPRTCSVLFLGALHDMTSAAGNICLRILLAAP